MTKVLHLRNGGVTIGKTGNINLNIMANQATLGLSQKGQMKYLETPLRPLPKGLPKIHDRIEHIRCLLGYPLTTFATKVGSAKASMKRVVMGETGPHYNMLETLLTVFPISPMWLHMGDGPMWTKNDISQYYYQSGPTDENTDAEIAARIREVRKDQDLSQPTFGGLLGVTKDQIAFIETGRTGVSPRLLQKMVMKFNVYPEWLLMGTGNKYRKKQAMA
jgi:DNA-binding XRE family transcriptional regulator